MEDHRPIATTVIGFICSVKKPCLQIHLKKINFETYKFICLVDVVDSVKFFNACFSIAFFIVIPVFSKIRIRNRNKKQQSLYMYRIIEESKHLLFWTINFKNCQIINAITSTSKIAHD